MKVPHAGSHSIVFSGDQRALFSFAMYAHTPLPILVYRWVGCLN